MVSYHYDVKQNSHAIPILGKTIAIFKNKELLNEIKKDFPEINNIHIVDSAREAKQIIEDYGIKNISMLYTDIKKTFKTQNYNNSYLFYQIEKEVSPTIVIDTKKDLDNKLSNSSLTNIDLIYDLSLTQVIKQKGKKVNKIIEILPNGIQIALKINGLWKIFIDNEINTFFLNKTKQKPVIENEFSPNPFENKYKKNENIFYNGYEFSYAKEAEYFKDIITWLISDNLYLDICDYINEKGNFINISKTFKVEKNINFDNFVEHLLNKDEIKGIEYRGITKISDDKYKISTKNGYIYMSKIDKEITITTFANSKSSEFDLKKYTNGLFINIENQIKQIHNTNSISKKNIFKIVAGLILFVILFYATFSLLFSIDNLTLVFSSLFSKDTLTDPWIYLIWLSFVFTFFQPLLVGVFMQKVIIRQKFDWKSLKAYYVSGLLRSVASFLTGNHIIALMVWGWYLNKKLEIKVATLVGAIGVASVVRSLIYLIIGSIFMVIGTASFFLKYYSPGQVDIIVLFTISWVGFAWESLHKVWVFLLVLSPVAQVLTANMFLSIKSLTRKLTLRDYNNTYQNVLLLRKSSPKLSWKREKARMIRSIILVCLPIFIESIETILYFDLIDSFILREVGNYDLFTPYYNFIDTSGLRLVAANVNNFPLLRALPGRGMFVSEYGLNSLYSVIYSNAHKGINVWGSYTSNDMAQMTTFLTRFFNVYLMMLIKIILSMIILLKITITRLKNK